MCLTTSAMYLLGLNTLFSSPTMPLDTASTVALTIVTHRISLSHITFACNSLSSSSSGSASATAASAPTM